MLKKYLQLKKYTTVLGSKENRCIYSQKNMYGLITKLYSKPFQ